MKLKFSLKYAIVFLSLLFVMHELHEIMHTSIGRVICGCWGKRDFNQWDLCSGCVEEYPISIIATIAGPLFSFAMIWLGVPFLKKHSLPMKSLGFALVFSNMPFGRLLSALLGMGDEVYILEHFELSENMAHGIGVLIVFVIIYYPLALAFRTLRVKKRVLWFIVFLLLPLLIDIILVLIGLNTLLSKGFLNEYWILGSPALVTCWTTLVLVAFVISFKHIFSLFSSKEIKL